MKQISFTQALLLVGFLVCNSAFMTESAFANDGCEILTGNHFLAHKPAETGSTIVNTAGIPRADTVVHYNGRTFLVASQGSQFNYKGTPETLKPALNLAAK